jgi:hypothetical protein
MYEPPRCPHCNTRLTEDAVLCVECGYHFEKGTRLKTQRKPFRRVWNTTVAPEVLLGIAGTVFVVTVVVAVVREGEGWWTILLALLFGLLLSAVGRRMVIERDRRGQPHLTIDRMLLFMPLINQSEIELEPYDAVYTDFSSDGESDWFVLELRGERVQPMVIYRGGNEQLMKELLDTLQKVAHMRVERK